MNFKSFIVGVYSFLLLMIGIILMIAFKNKIHNLRKLWAYSIIKVIGIKITQIGKIDQTANLIVLNHNSMLDVIILDYLYPKEKKASAGEIKLICLKTITTKEVNWYKTLEHDMKTTYNNYSNL